MTCVIRLDYRKPRDPGEAKVWGRTYAIGNDIYEIFINQNKQPFGRPEMLRTLLHEFTHVVLMIVKRTVKQEETLCGILEEMLTVLLNRLK